VIVFAACSTDVFAFSADVFALSAAALVFAAALAVESAFRFTSSAAFFAASAFFLIASRTPCAWTGRDVVVAAANMTNARSDRAKRRIRKPSVGL
jgi:hypothetical protein